MNAAGSPEVLVLGGGPDAERSVSLHSSRAVADALAATGEFSVRYEVVDRPSSEEIAAMRGDVVFPVLHGGWGEGGELQAILESSGRPFVGCGSLAAGLAMDKVAAKLAAARVGVQTAPCAILNPAQSRPPLPLPVVIKPVHEGSSVGLHICRDEREWAAGRAAAAEDLARGSNPARVYMVESMIRGRELTLGLIEEDGALVPLPIVEIRPQAGVYDFQAKYERGDTEYRVRPDLPEGAARRICDGGLRLAREIGVRHLCRVDFILDDAGEPWLLEVNTMPGFTKTSLLPKAAAAAGIDFPALCARLVRAALGAAQVVSPA